MAERMLSAHRRFAVPSREAVAEAVRQVTEARGRAATIAALRGLAKAAEAWAQWLEEEPRRGV